MSEDLGGGPGPITKVIIRTLWTRLFDDQPSNPIYLPRIIRDGYPEWGLPSYDPARPGGTSAPIVINGVPDDVADTACIRDDVEFPPIAVAAPTLQLLNEVFTNLSVMRPVSLTFSDSAPQFTVVVAVGTEGAPFTLAAADPEQPNFLFNVPCCEPVDASSRKCGPRARWSANASGQFVARAHEGVLTATIGLHTATGKPLSVSVEGVTVDVPQKNATVDTDVKGLPQWAQDMVQIAVNEGIASGAIVRGLETFLNQPNVVADLEKLINDALAKLMAEQDA